MDFFLGEIDRLGRKPERKKRIRFAPEELLFPLMLAPTFPLIALGELDFRRRPHGWRLKFDPEKVQLGMSESEVIEKLSAPRFSMVDGGIKTLAFGPKSTIVKRSPETFWLRRTDDERFWVSVSFENGKVVGTYSDDLFNEWEIIRPENYIDREMMKKQSNLLTKVTYFQANSDPRPRTISALSAVKKSSCPFVSFVDPNPIITTH